MAWDGGCLRPQSTEREQLHVTAEPQHGGRVEYLAEPFGIRIVGMGEKLAAGFGERIELLIGYRARVAVGDELDAPDGKFQRLEIGETPFDDVQGRPASFNSAQDAAWTQL
jgi:hypothetical protein